MTSRSANALVVTRNGGSDVLDLQTRDFAEPAGSELLVRVATAGINFIDIYRREGVYPTSPPFVAGSEGAGVVEAIGPDVTEFAVGDQVAWSEAPGSAAGLVTVLEQDAVAVPAGVELDTAAAVMLQGMTAHYLVNSTYAVQAGDVVLVHAAAGGVGQLLVQLVKAKGASVIATVSTPAKADKASALGADQVINYAEVPDVAAVVRGLTDGVGVAAVYDGVGQATFDASLRSLRRRGTLALFGAASGAVPPVDPQRLNSGGSLFLTRPTLAHYVATRAELLWRAGDVLAAVADGSLLVEIGAEYPLADAAQAYDDLQGRRTTGKLLLRP